MDAAFANGNIGSYDDYLERLKEAYGLHNVKLGYNKAVKVATFLGNKQMVIKEGKIIFSIQNAARTTLELYFIAGAYILE